MGHHTLVIRCEEISQRADLLREHSQRLRADSDDLIAWLRELRARSEAAKAVAREVARKLKRPITRDGR